MPFLGDSAGLSYDAATNSISAYAPASYGAVEVWVDSLDAPALHPMAQFGAGQKWNSGAIPWLNPGNKYDFSLEDSSGNVLASLTVDTQSGTPVVSGGAALPATAPVVAPGPVPVLPTPIVSSSLPWLSQDSLGFGFSNLIYLVIGGGAVVLLKGRG